MNTCFSLIKRRIQIVVISLDLVIFVVITSIINKNNDDYNEYTSLSKYCSNCYIFLIFLILLLHSIYPKLICKFLSDNLGILVCDKGKIIIILSIGVLYLNNNNTPQFFFSIFNFLSSFVLILCELFYLCKKTKTNNIGSDIKNNTEDKNNIDILNDSKINVFKNKK